jgi:low affinity Fe/Cu permease
LKSAPADAKKSRKPRYKLVQRVQCAQPTLRRTSRQSNLIVRTRLRSAQVFRVRGVAFNDVLNVRDGPSSDHRATGAIPAYALDVRVVGECVAEWCPIYHRGVGGWVHSYYLVEHAALRGSYRTRRGLGAGPPGVNKERRLSVIGSTLAHQRPHRACGRTGLTGYHRPWAEHRRDVTRCLYVHTIRQILTRLGTLAAHPIAFLIVAIYAACWLVFSPDTLDWHAVTTLAVWCMTLLIQRAEHRDTQAIHAKLDELLTADKGARTAVAHVDDKEPEEIERFRERERAGQ